MAITSKEINLAQLSKELGGKGLIGDFNDAKKKLIVAADGVNLSEEELESAIDNHIAIDDAKVKATVKAALLSKLGISESEARLLLS